MTSIRLLALSVAAAVALPGGGEAQTVESPYRYIETGQEAGLFVGILDIGAGRFDLGPDEGILYGGRYSAEISGPFSVEGVVRAFSAERAVIDPRRPRDEWDVGTADALITSLDGRIKFSLPGRRTWHGFGPYVMAGGGIAMDLAGESAVERDELEERDRFEYGVSFVGLLGGGVRWVPNDYFEVRTDGGLNLWQIDTPDGWGEEGRGLPSVEAPPESEWVSGLSLSLGVAVRW